MQPKANLEANLEPNPSSIKHSAVKKNNHQKNSETDLNSVNGVDSDQVIVSSSELELDLIYDLVLFREVQ